MSIMNFVRISVYWSCIIISLPLWLEMIECMNLNVIGSVTFLVFGILITYAALSLAELCAANMIEMLDKKIMEASPMYL